ncbi:MAG: hypothetical protein R3Y62_07895 [Eubacteriales bacterium]
MYSNDFETAFDHFIERKEYDTAQSALFSLVRAAFIAGWQSAGGTPPTPHKMFELLPPSNPQANNHR